MKNIKWLICVIIVIMTTGCWDYREINDLAIVGAIGIDAKDDNYNVSVQIVNAKKVASSTGSGGGASDEAPITVYEAEGKSIKEALNKITLDSPKNLYLGHVYIIIVGDELAKKGLKSIFDFFLRDTEVRKIFPFAIAEDGKASDILKIISPIETISSGNISQSLKITAAKSGVVSNRTFDQVLQCIYTEGREATITSLKLIGEKKDGQTQENISASAPKAYVKVNGSAALDGYKVVGYLDEIKSTGYTILRSKIEKLIITFPCDEKGNYGTAETLVLASELKADTKDNNVKLKVSIEGRAALDEYNCKLDLTDPKNIKKVEKIINKELEKIAGDTIKKGQEFGVDLFGFGEMLYRHEYEKWQKYKKGWNDTFSKVEYEVKSKVTIESIGSTITSAKDR